MSSTYIDENGIWTGSINANSITTGKLDVNRLTLKGLNIKNNSGTTTFAIDSGGNVTLGAKLSYDYDDLAGSKPPIDADNTRDWVTAKGLTCKDEKLWVNADCIEGGALTATEYIQMYIGDNAVHYKVLTTNDTITAVFG